MMRLALMRRAPNKRCQPKRRYISPITSRTPTQMRDSWRQFARRTLGGTGLFLAWRFRSVSAANCFGQNRCDCVDSDCRISSMISRPSCFSCRSCSSLVAVPTWRSTFCLTFLPLRTDFTICTRVRSWSFFSRTNMLEVIVKRGCNVK